MHTPLPYRTYKYSVVLAIIIINVVLFVFSRFLPTLWGYLAMNPMRFLSGQYWTVVTYMFSHASFSHLFFNMLGLYFFGTIVERLWGSNEFLLLYGVIGILAGVFSLLVYLITKNYYVYLIGASGAVYGVLLIFACMFPYQRIYVFGIFPVTAKVLMLIFIGIQMLSIVTGSQSGIAYFTHLSGIGVAWLYLYIRHHINPYHRLFGK